MKELIAEYKITLEGLAHLYDQLVCDAIKEREPKRKAELEKRRFGIHCKIHVFQEVIRDMEQLTE